MVARIKKNDTVVVLSGKDKDKKGTVIEVLPKKGKVLVKDIALVTRHVKARKQGEVSGIKKEESYINASMIDASMRFLQTALSRKCKSN